MADKDTGTDLLEGAYAIRSPQDNVDYYRDFAQSYDSEFVAGLGYVYHDRLADIFRQAGGQGPVADIGCGTGAVGAALGLTAAMLDGVDISPQMLEQARSKQVYGALYEMDLTARPDPPRRYNAVVSAGTFTHGHLGPEVLIQLLDWGLPGALFCVGVNAAHYTALGFEAALDTAVRAGRITPPVPHQVEIYTNKAHSHSADTALVLVFART